MPKTRPQKEEILTSLIDRLQRAQSVVLLNTQGVKVGEMESMRDALFPQGLQLQVAKNNLLKLALKEVGLEMPSELLDQPIGLVYSYEDPVAAAKLMAPFWKEIEALELLGGLMDGAFLSPAQIEALAKLPSKEQLLGQLVGTLAAPLSGLVNVLSGNLRGLVTVISQIQISQA